MSIKIITPPASGPVALSDALLHCRIDGTTENSIVTADIAAAREYCEAFQNRAYLPQTIEASYDSWPKFPVSLPRPPLATVVSIKYFDTANTEYTLAPADYFVDTGSEPGRVALTYGFSLPATTLRDIAAVKIRYTAGAATVSQRVKKAMLLLIGYWYENREAANSGRFVAAEVAFSVKSLLRLDRVDPA